MNTVDEARRRRTSRSDYVPVTTGAEDDDYTPDMAKQAIDAYFDSGSARERQLDDVLEPDRNNRQVST